MLPNGRRKESTRPDHESGKNRGFNSGEPILPDRPSGTPNLIAYSENAARKPAPREPGGRIRPSGDGRSDQSIRALSADAYALSFSEQECDAAILVELLNVTQSSFLHR
jgi:hypothetical protein